MKSASMASAQVDGTAATKKNVVDLIIGKDVPGTIVTIKVARSGVQAPFEVALKRACTADLAEKKKMFELFTSLKDKASHAKHDDGSRKIIDEVGNGKACLHSWAERRACVGLALERTRLCCAVCPGSITWCAA
jgi:hypothetical protein